MKFSRALVGIGCTVAVVIGCHRKPLATPESTWSRVVTPDSVIQFQLPPGYRQRNVYGCWDRSDGLWPALRDFCLTLTSAEEAESRAQAWSVPCTSDGVSVVADGSCYSDPRIDTVRYGDRSMVVIRAFLSGTIGHYDRVPAVLIRVPLGVAGTAVLSGTYRGDGDTELMAIASTIHLVPARLTF